MLAGFVFMLIGSTCNADDTALGAVGGVLSPMTKHPSIRMVSEDVRIKIEDDRTKIDDRIDDWVGMSVRCRFVFQNLGEACTVKMGFPEDRGGDSSGLNDFTSKVDGKPVKVQHVEAKHNLDDQPSGRGWYVKTVHFDKGQTRIVEDSYTGSASGDSTNVSQEVYYILETGNAWNGTIGKAVITADITEVRNFQTISAYPKNCKRDGNIIRWEFIDFKPSGSDNICLTFAGDIYCAFNVNGKDIFDDLVSDFIETGTAALIIDKVLMVDCRQLGHIIFGYEMVEGIPVAVEVNNTISESKDHKTYAINIDQPKYVDVWNGDKNVQVPLPKRKSAVIAVTVGSLHASVNGRPLVLKTAPTIHKGVLRLPFIQMARAMGVNASRDLNTGVTYVRTKK